jgi:hypothetical protein
MMTSLKMRTVLVLVPCCALIGCISFPAPGDTAHRYEVDAGAEQSFDRIHDNMDTRSYNLAAGALARGDKKAANRNIGRLDATGGQFNRQNAGNLRALSACTAQAKNRSDQTTACGTRQ